MKSSTPTNRQYLIMGLFALACTLISTFGPRLVERGSLDSFSISGSHAVRPPYGMGLWQYDALSRARAKAGLPGVRILQTIGNARASSGYHARDGYAREHGNSYAYCAAVDLSTRGLNTVAIKRLLSALADAGYSGWYRRDGQVGGSNAHIHAIWVGYPMKAELRQQYRRFITGRAGLAGNPPETFWRASPAQIKRLNAMYVQRNSLKN